MKKVLFAAAVFALLISLPAYGQEGVFVPSGAYVAIGNFFYRQGYIDDAARFFERAIQVDDNAVAHHNLGIAYYSAGSIAKAESEFGKALLGNPGYARAHNSLGLLLFHSGRHEEAAAEFSMVVALSPGNAQAHFDLAVSIGSLVRSGKGSISGLEDALSHFREAERLQPGYPNAKQNIKVVEGLLEQYNELKSSVHQ